MGEGGDASWPGGHRRRRWADHVKQGDKASITD